ncbi:MAG: type II toxin-antitoxin system VapC family toxin [Candidatus Bathyarchaeota archaeon]|nr:type II toxin-antitoxin system VapC family toxin [Candidatus Bathyarchaeota archaeon]
MLLDANILVKTVLEEQGSGKARRLIRSAFNSGFAPATMDHALPEALTALWKHHVLLKEISADALLQAGRDLIDLYDRLAIIHARDVAEEATRLSVDTGLTPYDTLYVAAAIQGHCTLHTADEKLARVAKTLTSVRLLDE